MAGHVEGRDDLDAPRLRRLEDLDVIARGEEAVDGGVAVGTCAQFWKQTAGLGWVVTAVPANLCQLGQACNLQPPSFVVAEVQVQLVELVAAHLPDDLEHFGLAVEVARQIDVEPAKAEARRVVDLDRSEEAALVRDL